jgi:hypothetical protein
MLSQNGRSLVLRVLEPVDAMVRTARVLAPEPQGQQPDVTAIRAVLPRRTASARIVIWLSTGDRPAPAVIPLAEWR